MLKLINRLLFFSKIIILLIDFVLTLYIMLMMNSIYNNGVLDIIMTCFSLFLILVIFVVSLIFKKGEDNIFFNISSFFALVTILIIDFRTIFDQNMVMWIKGNMNFYYFRNQLKIIKILGYLVFLGNLLVLYHEHLIGKKHS